MTKEAFALAIPISMTQDESCRELFNPEKACLRSRTKVGLRNVALGPRSLVQSMQPALALKILRTQSCKRSANGCKDVEHCREITESEQLAIISGRPAMPAACNGQASNVNASFGCFQ